MIEVKNVSKKYRKVKALDDISFNIEEGKITCILGINGVGKSTILKSIAGLIKPDKGEILIDNEKLTYKTYNKISFVPDVDNHFAQYTIKESFEDLLFDPQTSGGLLVSLKKKDAKEVLKRLQEQEQTRYSKIVGEVEEKQEVHLIFL